LPRHHRPLPGRPGRLGPQADRSGRGPRAGRVAAVSGSASWPAAVRVVRSQRRKRTIAARAEGDTLIVMVPAGISAQEGQRWGERMRERLRAGRERRELTRARPLAERAQELNRQYFGGRLHWRSIEYVTDQQHRYGSCTPSTGAIRISHRLASVPE